MTGKQVLLVEDEMMVAILAEDMLTELGYVVGEVAGTLSAGVQIAKTTQADVAVLDVNLGGENSAEIADVLSHRSIPFVFVTGYGAAGVQPQHGHRPILSKPYDLPALNQALLTALSN